MSMALSRLDRVNAGFQANAEALHDKFCAIRLDHCCSGCRSAGFGEAILTAWLQTSWGSFTRSLIIASTLGTRRTSANAFQALPGVRSNTDAERKVKAASAEVVEKHRYSDPVWHAPLFVVEVSNLLAIRNKSTIEITIGATSIPKQISRFRNYLVHPDERTRSEYNALQASLGMLRTEPEDLLHNEIKPGLPVFTEWVRELQRVAHASTR